VSSESVGSVAGPLDRYRAGFRRFLVDEEHYQPKPALKLAEVPPEPWRTPYAASIVAEFS
jgi:hypothetical protein